MHCCACNTAGTASDQAELPVRSSSVSPRWPCKSRQMANVTALHGGLNQQATKHHQAARSRPELAGFAARSSPISQGECVCSYAYGQQDMTSCSKRQMQHAGVLCKHARKKLMKQIAHCTSNSTSKSDSLKSCHQSRCCCYHIDSHVKQRHATSSRL